MAKERLHARSWCKGLRLNLTTNKRIDRCSRENSSRFNARKPQDYLRGTLWLSGKLVRCAGLKQGAVMYQHKPNTSPQRQGKQTVSRLLRELPNASNRFDSARNSQGVETCSSRSILVNIHFYQEPIIAAAFIIFVNLSDIHFQQNGCRAITMRWF